MEHISIDLLKRILRTITEINKGTLKIEKLIAELSIPSREELIEQIHEDLLIKNTSYTDESLKKKRANKDRKEEHFSSQNLIEKTLGDIRKTPVKKVFFLRKFLDRFSDISELDKNVVLKSLENTEMSQLPGKMKSLATTFKLKEPEEYF
ncbi:MAG: hypothetical protein BAJALOKI1v1_160008 [Promethearchaeota archaeon]|nr:MAG: hypothetical protein BAJALOKI1v1_160008 [Candidatus Lokiarchaeota archaeon]